MLGISKLFLFVITEMAEPEQPNTIIELKRYPVPHHYRNGLFLTQPPNSTNNVGVLFPDRSTLKLWHITRETETDIYL